MARETKLIKLDQENKTIAEKNKIDSITSKSDAILLQKHTEKLQNE